MVWPCGRMTMAQGTRPVGTGVDELPLLLAAPDKFRGTATAGRGG